MPTWPAAWPPWSACARRTRSAEERNQLTALAPPTPPLRLLWSTGIGSFGATGCLGAMVLLAVTAFLGSYHARPDVTSAAITVVIALMMVTAWVSTWLRYS